MLTRHASTSHRFFGMISRGAIVLLALALLSVPAFAVKRYTDPVFRQPKARLQHGMSMGLDAKHGFRFKQGKNLGISHGGVAPQFHKSTYTYSLARRRH